MRVQIESFAMIRGQLAALDAVWERCRLNFLFGLSSWVLWEVLNGYPTPERADKLHESIKGYVLPLPILVMKQQLVLSSLIPLGRLVDPIVNGRGKDRESLDQLRIFLDKPEVFEYFSDPVMVNEFCNFVNIDQVLWQGRFKQLKLRLHGHNRSLTSTRPDLKKFRDDWLAHSLKDAAPSRVTVFAIRDAFALVACILEAWAFLFYGRVWSSKELVQREMDQAKNFWGVFSDGLAAGND